MMSGSGITRRQSRSRTSGSTAWIVMQQITTWDAPETSQAREALFQPPRQQVLSSFRKYRVRSGNLGSESRKTAGARCSSPRQPS